MNNAIHYCLSVKNILMYTILSYIVKKEQIFYKYIFKLFFILVNTILKIV